MKLTERTAVVVETVYLDIFVIPNPAEKFSTFPDSSMKRIESELSAIGIIPENTDHMGQFWVTDTYPEDSPKHKDNWTCGYPTYGTGENDQQRTPAPKAWTKDTVYTRLNPTNFNFPTYLPLGLFKNKSERESVTLITDEGVKYVLRLNQKCYRYRSQGLFEKVLEHVVAIGR